MKRFFRPRAFGFLAFLLLFRPFHPALAAEWTFLPVTPLFRPLLGAPREPQTALLGYLGRSRYEGQVGAFMELLRYDPPDGTRWAWGILGAGFILLDEQGAVFPMRAGDWEAGMYLSEASGAFSHRLEFVHRSAHLGDSLQGQRQPFFYSRENFNYTLSLRPTGTLRFYAGLGAWENMAPQGKAFFASLGGECYSPALHPMGTFLRGYFTCDLQWEDEAGGVLNRTLEWGLQWKQAPEESRALRLALVYYDGNSQYGQFYLEPDEHWALGLFFDF
jgi:Protein of unknown function (DUF1207)